AERARRFGTIILLAGFPPVPILGGAINGKREEPAGAVSRHAERYLFRGKEDPVGLAENGEGGPVQGSQRRLSEARDRNRRARGAARKGVRGNRRSAPRQDLRSHHGHHRGGPGSNEG